MHPHKTCQNFPHYLFWHSHISKKGIVIREEVICVTKQALKVITKVWSYVVIKTTTIIVIMKSNTFDSNRQIPVISILLWEINDKF